MGPTVSAAGSFNTEVGLPLTILAADERTEFLVLEMGMRGEGHIAYLVDIARPDVGVVINVGSAHLGMLGSREAIARAKGELVRGLAPDAVAVLNADDPLVARRWRAPRLRAWSPSASRRTATSAPRTSASTTWRGRRSP